MNADPTASATYPPLQPFWAGPAAVATVLTLCVFWWFVDSDWWPTTPFWRQISWWQLHLVRTRKQRLALLKQRTKTHFQSARKKREEALLYKLWNEEQARLKREKKDAETRALAKAIVDEQEERLRGTYR